MEKTIHPIFNKMNISFEENLPKNATDIPVNHPTYKDIWRRIDEFIDKVYLVERFKEQEDEGTLTDDALQYKYDMYEELLTLNEKNIEAFPKFKYGFFQMFNHYKNEAKTAFQNGSIHESEQKGYIKNKLLNDPHIIDDFTDKEATFIVNNFNKEGDRLSEKEVFTRMQKITDTLYNKFSDAIVRKYPNECIEENRIILEKPDTAKNIIVDKEKIQDDFQNLLPGINDKNFEISPKGAYNKGAAIGTLITRQLEKYYGLRFNKRNGLFYISDGEGMYIPFNNDNLGPTFKKLHDRFYIREKNKDGNEVNKQYYWTKRDFYELASKYCIVEVESERNIITFPNCAYDIKERKIYDLDYRLPRLPIKSCEVNFVYDKDLNDRGGALKEVFDYCFDEKTKNRIFQHYGKALFERGYTESQDSLFLMGKGNVGKTTFITSLNMIFKNRSVKNAGDFKNSNDFKFGSLAESDIVLLDEISTAKKKEFLELLKLWTGGGESIECNPKYGKVIQLEAEYIPRLVSTGNNLSKALYKGAQGVGVLRRFDILFLKRSILEAKRLTVTIQGTKYPACQKEKEIYIIKEPTEYTETKEAIGPAYKFIKGQFVEQFDEEGNPLIIKQDRTYFSQNELRTKETLEWFLQQVILNYTPDTSKKVHEEELREAMLKAYCPEEWVIQNHVEPHYTENDNGDSHIDQSFILSADELLEMIHKVVDDNMLEKSISDPNSDDFHKVLRDTLKIRESFDKIEKGKKYFYGISFQ